MGILDVRDKPRELEALTTKRGYTALLATALRNLHFEHPYSDEHMLRDLRIIVDYILDRLDGK